MKKKEKTKGLTQSVKLKALILLVALAVSSLQTYIALDKTTLIVEASGTEAIHTIANMGRILSGNTFFMGVTYSNTYSTFVSTDAPLMHEAGIDILRLSFNPGNMPNLQRLVPAVDSEGFEMVGLLYNRPLLDANNIAEWGNWVYSTVSTYKNYVKVWEVWNEPDWNSGFAPDGQVGDVVKYSQWLKTAYENAKSADSSCKVLGGSISVIQDNTLTWIAQLKNNDGGSYLDALSIHPYVDGSPLPPAITTYGKAFWRADEAQALMDKPVWITEVGWRTSGSGNVISEADQARYITEALTYANSNWNWLEAFNIFQWQDGGGYYFGLLRSDGSAKPSYYAVKAFEESH